MKAVDVIRAYAIMCREEQNYGCAGCDLDVERNETEEPCNVYMAMHPQEAIKKIEEWVQKHPECFAEEKNNEK